MVPQLPRYRLPRVAPPYGKESTGAPTQGLEPVLVTGHWRSSPQGREGE
jgi:hypothetical protein